MSGCAGGGGQQRRRGQRGESEYVCTISHRTAAHLFLLPILTLCFVFRVTSLCSSRWSSLTPGRWILHAYIQSLVM